MAQHAEVSHEGEGQDAEGWPSNMGCVRGEYRTESWQTAHSLQETRGLAGSITPHDKIHGDIPTMTVSMSIEGRLVHSPRDMRLPPLPPLWQ